MANVVYPVGNITFVFTDIEDSSRMTRELEQTRVGAYEANLRDPHRKLLRELAQEHNGHEIHSAGDGHLLVFQFVKDALACVVKFQQELHKKPVTHIENGVTYEVKVRVGVHTAIVQRKPDMMANGLPEYPGGDTNYAARIGGLGAGGQIIVSKGTYNHAQELRAYAASPCAVHAWPGRFLKSFPGQHDVYEILYYDDQVALEPGMSGFAEWYRSERNRFVDRPGTEARVFAAFERTRGGGRLVTITGIGGTGKTRLAIACAARRADLYADGVYFVSLATADLVEDPNAASASRSEAFVAQAIGAALKRTGVDALPDALFQWLRTKNLLLVLDNYESVHCEAVGQYLIKIATETAGVSLLVTGRERVSGDDTEALIDLNDGMTKEEATDLFLARARLKGKLAGDLNGEQQTHLTRILDLTERIPLALELAAAWITRKTLAQIASSLNDTPLGTVTQADGIRADDTIALRRHRSLERSLTWSYNLLDAPAQRVLATASLFAETFDEAALLAIDAGEDAEAGLYALQDASLVRQRGDTEAEEVYRYSLHRATREFAARRLAVSADADAIKRRFVAHYVAFVEENGGKYDDPSYRSLLANEWRNALAAAYAAESIGDNESPGAIADRLIFYLDRQAHWAEPEPLYTRSLAIREAVLGAEHPDTATSLNNLALIYRDQGKYAAAEPLYRRALASREAVLGAEHPNTATSLNNLAILYYNQANLTAAEPLFNRALIIIEKELGAEHPYTIMLLNNLAYLYQTQGNYAASELLSKRALAVCEQTLGDEHPNTAICLNNLALLYDTQGNYAAAEPLYKQVIAICKKNLGDEHPSTAGALNNLASLYDTQGNYAAAEPLFKKALAIYEETLGSEHPDISSILNNLAELYRKQGDYAAAEPLYRRALAMREKMLGAEHPHTATSLNNLGLLYYHQGNYAAAEPLLEGAFRIREKALGAEHPAAADSLNNLAYLRQKQGNYATAESLFKRALAICEKTLGVEHPTTKTIRANIDVLNHQLHWRKLWSLPPLKR